jgi:hypothetical protein
VLHPGTSIAAHSGPCNLRLRCHFPLIVPKERESAPKTHGLMCGLRVGSEVHKWDEGKPLVFDDCYEHEVGVLSYAHTQLLHHLRLHPPSHVLPHALISYCDIGQVWHQGTTDQDSERVSFFLSIGA